MNVKTISYGFTKNLGNYQSERLDMTIELESDDDPKEAFKDLKQLVQNSLNSPPEPNSPEDLF